MRVLQRCGLQLGPSAEINELREGRVRDELWKPILRDGGFDELAQTSLPPVGWFPDSISVADFRDRVLELVGLDDYDCVWGFKGIKGLLFWRLLDAAFPQARWVYVNRPRTEHINSLMRTPFMTAHNTPEGWGHYLDEIDLHRRDLVTSGRNVMTFSPSTIRHGDEWHTGYLCNHCGVKYSGAALDEFDPRRYRS